MWKRLCLTPFETNVVKICDLPDYDLKICFDVWLRQCCNTIENMLLIKSLFLSTGCKAEVPLCFGRGYSQTGWAGEEDGQGSGRLQTLLGGQESSPPGMPRGPEDQWSGLAFAELFRMLMFLYMPYISWIWRSHPTSLNYMIQCLHRPE